MGAVQVGGSHRGHFAGIVAINDWLFWRLASGVQFAINAFMRPVLLLCALLLLTRCGTTSQYDANSGQAPSSLNGSQGGGGVQTSIWSNDPSQKTITNQNPQ